MSHFISDFKIELQKNKIPYYTKNYLRQLIPAGYYRGLLESKLGEALETADEKLLTRLHYYNKMDSFNPLQENIHSINEFKIFESPKTYRFDLYEYLRYYDPNYRFAFYGRDIIHIPDIPTIVKSRPISDNNQNSVLMKLDKKRHFVFINDPYSFREKKDMLIGRGFMEQPHRIKFMEMYFNHPLCDLGSVSKYEKNTSWIKPKLPISAHLKYKFILSLEGNDVATNLKWIMSSNSLAVMPRPKYETWFMEGTLIPDYHYIEIKDDYSDLEEKVSYYSKNPSAAEVIVANAHTFVSQFKNKKLEDQLSLMVLEKYFKYTNQIG